MSGLQKREGLEGSDPIHKHLPSTHDNFFIEENYTKAPDCNTGQFVMLVKQTDVWPPRVSLKNEKERARVWHRGWSDGFLPSTHWGAPRRHWPLKVSGHAGVTQTRGLGQWDIIKSDLISLEFITLCLASILPLPLPKFPSFPIEETAWLPGEKYFTLQTTFREQEKSLLAVLPGCHCPQSVTGTLPCQSNPYLLPAPVSPHPVQHLTAVFASSPPPASRFLSQICLCWKTNSHQPQVQLSSSSFCQPTAFLAS